MTDREDIKRSAFKRLATSRVNRVLRELRLIGNLSNTQNYDYSEKDIRLIFKAVDSELGLVKSRFDVGLKKVNSIKIE